MVMKRKNPSLFYVISKGPNHIKITDFNSIDKAITFAQNLNKKIGFMAMPLLREDLIEIKLQLMNKEL